MITLHIHFGINLSDFSLISWNHSHFSTTPHLKTVTKIVRLICFFSQLFVRSHLWPICACIPNQSRRNSVSQRLDLLWFLMRLPLGFPKIRYFFFYCNCHLNFVIFGDHFLTTFFFFHFFKNGTSLERWADFSEARLISGGDCQIMYWNRCHKIWPSYHAWSLLSISIIAHHQWLLEGNQILRNYHQPYNLTIICENPARHVRICILTEISKTYLGILEDHFDDYCLVLYCLEKSICFSKCLCIDFLSFSMMIY